MKNVFIIKTKHGMPDKANASLSSAPSVLCTNMKIAISAVICPIVFNNDAYAGF